MGVQELCVNKLESWPSTDMSSERGWVVRKQTAGEGKGNSGRETSEGSKESDEALWGSECLESAVIQDKSLSCSWDFSDSNPPWLLTESLYVSYGMCSVIKRGNCVLKGPLQELDFRKGGLERGQMVCCRSKGLYQQKWRRESGRGGDTWDQARVRTILRMAMLIS